MVEGYVLRFASGKEDENRRETEKMEDGPRMKGTVKALKRVESYGFISHTPTGIDHFFHRSAIVQPSPVDWEDLQLMQAVEFDAEEGPKGFRAVNVRIV